MKPQNRPLFGRPNMFPLWQQWLWSLGGSFEAVAHTDEPKEPTGRRDPDKRPRTYPLSDKKYGKDPATGTIWRRP